MAERGEGAEVAPRPAAEVEDRERRRAFDVPQQRGDVLAHVVVARAGAEVLGVLVVVRERPGGDLGEIGRGRHWFRWAYANRIGSPDTASRPSNAPSIS